MKLDENVIQTLVQITKKSKIMKGIGQQCKIL